MNAKELLKDCRNQQIKYRLIEERIERLKSAIESTTHRISEVNVQGSKQDKLAEYVVQLEELQDKQTETLIDCLQKILEAEDVIEKLPDQQQTVMRLRYLDGYSWREVAKETHYSEKHIFKIHAAAMRKVDTQ